MSDLSEALAQLDDYLQGDDLFLNIDALTVMVAAARNWHALEPHLNDLDSIVSLILHRHNIDPPLPFDERQRLQAAIGAIRRVDALTGTEPEKITYDEARQRGLVE